MFNLKHQHNKYSVLVHSEIVIRSYAIILVQDNDVRA